MVARRYGQMFGFGHCIEANDQFDRNWVKVGIRKCIGVPVPEANR